MERRKLQATGGRSLTLTLPKIWTDKLMLKSKDEVIVNTVGSALLVKPTRKSKQEIIIDIPLDNKQEQWIMREMIGAYIAGADKIALKSKRVSSVQNQTIRQAVSVLFGYEIVEETSKKVVAKSVLDDSSFPVSESALRMFMITRSMFEDALLAAKNGDKELAEDIKLRDYEVNKMLYAIQRQFQKILLGINEGDIEEVNFNRNVSVQLERIGDHAVKIAELASTDRTDPVKLSTTFPTIKKRIHELLKDVEIMVKDLDKQHGHKILDGGKELEELIYSSRRMKQSYEGAIIEDSLDRLRGYIMNIAELTIDYAIIRTQMKN